MFETLEALDRQLLLLINGANTPFLDQLMWIVSGKLTWIPLYALLLFFICKKAGKNWWIMLICIGLAILLADQISVNCFKNVIQRYRPTRNLEIGNLVHVVNNYRGGKYGFVSSHAANTFAISMLVCLFFKKKAVWYGMMAWAVLVCYSRMYLGVHYPADIVCGGLLGLACGYAAYKFHGWLSTYIEKKRSIEHQPNCQKQ